MPPAVVLVTGVSRWLGGALAAELAADPAIERVIGVDTVPPSPAMLRRLGRTRRPRASPVQLVRGQIGDVRAQTLHAHHARPRAAMLLLLRQRARRHHGDEQQ